MESAKEILNRQNLKGTPTRIAILNVIIKSETSLSELEIKNKIQNVDRITFYRSMRNLLETNVIHGVITQGKIIKYALSINDANKGSAIQFYCTECERMIDVKIDNKKTFIPDGYSEKSCHIAITGTCKSCNNKK